MRLLNLLISLIALTTPVYADDSKDLSVPSTRYIRENPNEWTLTQWSSEIVFEASGDFSANIGFQAAALLQSLAIHAETAVKLVGDPSYWFQPKESVSAKTNYLVLFRDLNGEVTDRAEEVQIERDFKIEVSNSSPELRELLSTSLPIQGPGCFSAWNANATNKVRAFALVVDTRLSITEQQECIRFMIPVSLGVVPVFTNLEWTGGGGAKPSVSRKPFIDESELIFLLRASAYCRNTLEDNSLQCPADLLGYAYRQHESMLETSREND